MRRELSSAVALVLVGVLAGCSSGGGGGSEGDDGKPGPAGGVARNAPLAKLDLPPTYDPTTGWDETLSWVNGGVHSLPVMPMPSGKAVAMLDAASEGYTPRVRDVDTGAVKWTGRSWRPPAPVEGAAGDLDTGTAREIPGVTATSAGGTEYVIAYAHGLKGKDDLHEGEEVLQLAVYQADKPGKDVAPTREISVPVKADPGEVQVGTFGDGLIVAWGEGMLAPNSARVELHTGKVTRFEEPHRELSGCADDDDHSLSYCSDGRVAGLTDKGPVISVDGGGFGLAEGWFSGDVRPTGVPEKTGFLGQWNGTLYGVTNNRVLAAWNRAGYKGDPVWSVHDAETGKLQAQMPCATKGQQGADRGDRDFPVVSSPSGRYLGAGAVAFDVERRKGYCLAGNGNRKTIELTHVRDDGNAYGAVADSKEDSEPLPAKVNLSKEAEAQVLDAGTDFPLAQMGRYSLFLSRDDDDALRVSVRRDR